MDFGSYQLTRPSFDKTFLCIARVLSERATCPRRAVGAVLVSKDNKIVGTGYNGSPHNMPHCIESGCLLVDNHCVRTVHAEMNAIINSVDLGLLNESTLYLYGAAPCYNCANALITVGVSEVIYISHGGPYGEATDYLMDAGIPVEEVRWDLL